VKKSRSLFAERGEEGKNLVVVWSWCQVGLMMSWKRERKEEVIVIMMS